MSRSILPRERLPMVAGIAALTVLASALRAQSDVKADPHASQHPAALTVPKDGNAGSAVLSKAVADLGESPLAAIYDAASPEMRAFAQHNLTLSNPFFEGRVPGSHGNRVAADYIEYYFRQAKLIPGFASEMTAADGTKVLTPNTTFRQPFKVGNEIKVQQAEASFDLGPGGVVTLKEGTDFTVLGMSGSGTITAPLVFVGYSISQGQDGYETYTKTTDLSGKIAVVLRFEPMKANGKSRWVDDGWSPAASMDAKIQAAADHHAAGVIFVNPPETDDQKASLLSRTEDTKAVGSTLTIPVVMATTKLVDRLVRAADGEDRTLMAFRKLADEKGGVVELPKAKATLTTRLSYEPVMTDNVGGVLPGKGKLADQFLVIGAHYDHVGYGPVGTQPQNNGKLHPGADDNGSGTCGVLVLADNISRAYAELPAGADARSILFLTFSAEESGLIGSHYYVAHPSIDLKQMYLMLNMDMIGRLRESKDDPNHGLEVQGTESAQGLYDWLTPYFAATPGVEIKHGSEVAGNSDHASFYQKQLPVLFFFTGLHRQYHTPQDTGFTINQLGAAKVIDLVYRIAMGAAQRTEPLKFTPRREEKQTDPHAGDQAAANPPKGVGRVRFGVAPASYSDDKPGVEVGDVYEGTCAAEAGIKIGDRLMKWNGKDIANVEAWMPLLTSQKPGDEVEVTLVRDGKEMTVKVKLKARDQGGK